MKSTVSVMACLLAPSALARPSLVTQEDPIPGSSRITAFVVDDKGNPSVECWEIGGILQSAPVQRTDSTKATAHALSLARSDALEGVDILTWPSIADIWPPSNSDDLHVENVDLSNTFNLFSIQGGLINFNFYAARFGVTTKDDVETHIFSMENGDDWFYFEDSSASSSSRKSSATPYPFHISTISGTETELLRLRYKSQPKHTVLHKGACSFTGIVVPDDAKSAPSTSGGHSGITVQVNVEDL